MNRLAEVIDVLQRPGGWRAVFTSRPRSLASFRLVRALADDDLQFRTVIDGGANLGQFARAVSMVYPQATIFSFEPLADVARQLRANLRDHSGHEVLEFALGDKDGTISFHRNEYSQSSSVLRTSAADDGLASGKQSVATLDVPIRKLDTVFADRELQEPILLKLDLQGYELPALRGGAWLAQRCSHMLIETVFTPSYEDEPLFEELHDFVRSQGFSFVRPVHFARNAKGRIVQMDALFSRGS